MSWHDKITSTKNSLLYFWSTLILKWKERQVKKEKTWWKGKFTFSISACRTFKSFLDCWSSCVSLVLVWSSCCSKARWVPCSWESSYITYYEKLIFQATDSYLSMIKPSDTFWLTRSWSLSFCSRARLQLSALCLWQLISSVVCLSFCSTAEH